MLRDLFKRLTGDAPADDLQTDYRRALAALMVRLARVDGHFDTSEADVIRAVLTKRYALSGAEAQALAEDGASLEAEAGDTVHLTKAIKDGVPYEERTAIIEALWRVVLADETRDYEENAFLRLAAKLLGVNDVDSALARQRATMDTP